MIKILPAVEKKFDMNEVGQSYPSWVRVVMILFVMAIFFGAVFADWAYARDYYYVIKPNVKVLAFIGDPGSLDTIPESYVTAEEQVVLLMHKKSGPGLYAFHLQGLLVKSDSGVPYSVDSTGFIVVKRRHVRPYK